MRYFILLAGLLLLFTTEILRAYSLMPVTDVQDNNKLVTTTYFFYHNSFWLRLLALALIAYPLFYILKRGKIWLKLLLIPIMVGYVLVFYYFNYYMSAIEVYQPVRVKRFALKQQNQVKNNKLVIGVAVNGEAKAYPIQVLGYHHGIEDTIGGLPVIVTYCTLCRSARVFSATIKGKPAAFKLMGLNNYNSVFEDEVSKSWWQQETGVAIAGAMKDKKLDEIPSSQLTLLNWLKKYPDTEVMQPDTNYLAAYRLDDNDRAFFGFKYTGASAVEKKDKALVAGIVHDGIAKAYDWDIITYQKLVEDSMPALPVLLTLEGDNVAVHAWNRTINGEVLHFEKLPGSTEIKDTNTQSTWNMQGTCIEGPLQGTQLEEVPVHLETWKSWSSFHPETEVYKDFEIKSMY